MFNQQEMLDKAWAAASHSYSPYSGFRVGACLLCKNGAYYLGCNVENASYGLTNCAERTAIFSAVANGDRDFLAIAVVGGSSGQSEGEGGDALPCGACLQVMSEFCNPDEFQVIVGTKSGSGRIFTLRELLPYGFALK